MISIITSLYRTDKYLPAFLLHAQKVHEGLFKAQVAFEHILIANDPSSNELTLIQKSNLTFTVLNVPRETLYASWNRGAKSARYNAVTFWAVDDTRNASAIIHGLETLRNENDCTYFDHLYKRYTIVLGIPILIFRKKITPIEYSRDLFICGMYAGPHFIVRKSAFETIGYFDETYKIAGDFDWWARAAKNALRIKKTDEVSGTFVNEGTSLSGSKNPLQAAENERVYKRYSK
jgi:hypothetical protein